MNHSWGTTRTGARRGKARFGRSAPAAAGRGALLLALGAQACGQSSGTPRRVRQTSGHGQRGAGGRRRDRVRGRHRALRARLDRALHAPVSTAPVAPTHGATLSRRNTRPSSGHQRRLGPAPCDFDRSYRGSVDKTPLTIIIHASGQAIQVSRTTTRRGPPPRSRGRVAAPPTSPSLRTPAARSPATATTRACSAASSCSARERASSSSGHSRRRGPASTTSSAR